MLKQLAWLVGFCTPDVNDTDSWQANTTVVRSPVAYMKAIKNETEIEGFRQSHIRDGAALARYFAWLEEQLYQNIELNESQGADKLEAHRS